jgi:hypothetical protein
VLAVYGVYSGSTQALVIRNTDTSNQQAFVREVIDHASGSAPTGLYLQRTASGVASSATLTYATYPTLDLLAAAVVALGNGWTATVTSPYGSWPSAQLRVTESDAGDVDAVLSLYSDRYVPRSLDTEAGLIETRSSSPVRVSYRAGYETIPEDIQWAAYLIVRANLVTDQTLDSDRVKSHRLGDRSIEYTDRMTGMAVPSEALSILRRYRTPVVA